MLGIKPWAAGFRSKCVNHCAVLPPTKKMFHIIGSHEIFYGRPPSTDKPPLKVPIYIYRQKATNVIHSLLQAEKGASLRPKPVNILIFIYQIKRFSKETSKIKASAFVCIKCLAG